MLTPAGPAIVPIDTPVLHADDLGATRGDGAFETMHIRGDGAFMIDEHLARLVNSLRRLDIVPPPRDQLAAVVAAAVAQWRADPSRPEAGVKLVCTRGVEHAPGSPTVYAIAFPIPDAFVRSRRDGVKLATLSWGFPADEREQAPWLLGGVKSLSYAVNMAALREASRRGCCDVLFVSSDGTVLEGPTAGVVWQQGDTLVTSPNELGILPSTTVSYLFSQVKAADLATDRRQITRAELLATDGAWLCSSVRGVVPITGLDDDVMATSPLTAQLRQIAGFPV